MAETRLENQLDKRDGAIRKHMRDSFTSWFPETKKMNDISWQDNFFRFIEQLTHEQARDLIKYIGEHHTKKVGRANPKAPCPSMMYSEVKRILNHAREEAQRREFCKVAPKQEPRNEAQLQAWMDKLEEVGFQPRTQAQIEDYLAGGNGMGTDAV